MATMKTKNKKEQRTALITGITGQDGSYLAELLLSKGYKVHGIIRRSSTFSTGRVDHLFQEVHAKNRTFFMHHGDLADANIIRKLLYSIKPDEIYNLGAQSHVRVSFDIPEYTANITGLGTLRILDAIKDYQEDTGKKVKFYQASSSEMFGSAPAPQNEKTQFQPRSPYAVAKIFSYHTAVNYREAYGIFAANGILFNHESPRRGSTFVTKKITAGLAKIVAGKEKKIYLGNLDAKRDWGYAPEYCEAMWLMLQQNKADDYVIGTGETHSVREFVQLAFNTVGLENYKKYIEIDNRYYRPSEVNVLMADTAKAKDKLKWEPKTKFKDLVKIMVEEDLKNEGLL